MSVSVRIPGPLRPYCDGQAQLVVEAATVAATLGALPAGVRDRVLDEQGRVRVHVNVFVDKEDIRFLGGLLAPLQASSVIHVLNAVSGG